MPETMEHSGKSSKVQKALFYFVSSVTPMTSLKRGAGERRHSSGLSAWRRLRCNILRLSWITWHQPCLHQATKLQPQQGQSCDLSTTLVKGQSSGPEVHCWGSWCHMSPAPKIIPLNLSSKKFGDDIDKAMGDWKCLRMTGNGPFKAVSLPLPRSSKLWKDG